MLEISTSRDDAKSLLVFIRVGDDDADTNTFVTVADEPAPQ